MAGDFQVSNVCSFNCVHCVLKILSVFICKRFLEVAIKNFLFLA